MRNTIRRCSLCVTAWAALATVTSLSPIPSQAAESCSTRAGYPLGRWGVGTRGATAAEYSTFITFTDGYSGTWLPSSGTGSFRVSAVPAPGRAVNITLAVEGSAYRSENRLVVSADGCRMSGTFQDTEGHRGEAVYQWQGVN